MTHLLPQHIGLIMDGNRRWARQHKKPSLYGHLKGKEVVQKVPDWLVERGIKFITLWAFSTENWKRSEQEIDYLFQLFRFVLQKEWQIWANKDYRVVMSGNLQAFPKDIQEMGERVIEKTKNNQKAVINLGLNYGGRAEILEAVRKILKDKSKNSALTEEFFKQFLYQPNLPDIDLIVRTSGEQRLSGFFPWQSVYAELIFLDKHWPDLQEKDIDIVLQEFSRRKRRFGL